MADAHYQRKQTNLVVKQGYSIMSNPLRSGVLGLYKKILRLGRTWCAVVPENSESERNYIRTEARFWFKENKYVPLQYVSEHILEGEARVEMALHYRNPYPRPVNLPPKTYTSKQGKRAGIAQDRLKEISRPLYAKSIDRDSGM